MRLGTKILIVVAVFFCVIIGGGVLVYATQHNNPRFCNALCHSPMDSYVEDYESGNSSLLVSAHAEAGQVCLDCHTSDLGQQIDEGIKWATGDFRDPMVLRRFGTEEFCLRSGCHAEYASYDDLVNATANYEGSGYNPHKSSHGNIECYNCHSIHGSSKLHCRNCHSDIPEPATW
jgi:hypothetical protein